MAPSVNTFLPSCSASALMPTPGNWPCNRTAMCLAVPWVDLIGCGYTPKQWHSRGSADCNWLSGCIGASKAQPLRRRPAKSGAPHSNDQRRIERLLLRDEAPVLFHGVTTFLPKIFLPTFAVERRASSVMPLCGRLPEIPNERLARHLMMAPRTAPRTARLT